MLNLIRAFISSPYLALAAICLAILTFVSQLMITERYKASIERDHDRFLEELRWDSRAREEAAKVAEYLSLQSNLKEGSPESEYDLVNRLGWELALWLPSDVYRKLGQAATSPNYQKRLDVIIEIRRLLLGVKAGNLTAADVMVHAPGIGEYSK
ncbi:MAG: hypothetical protein ABSC19_06690 [Syntrophorhabdales bacterium]|jgi:hypothetical protein